MMEWNYSHRCPAKVFSATTAATGLAQKVAFLSRPDTYGVDTVACRETHMSWVFLAGERAYKLKKPVRFSYLDFSSLARREAACRARAHPPVCTWCLSGGGAADSGSETRWNVLLGGIRAGRRLAGRYEPPG